VPSSRSGAWIATWVLLLAAGCGAREQTAAPASPEPAPAARSPFDQDVAFLREHTAVVLLRDADGTARVAVAPEYQGRVMTSTTGGDAGPSFGWVGRAAVAARRKQPHINVFGGEDRFWLGPEGGQFSLYFKPKDPFDLDHWQVPEAIDWGGWNIEEQTAATVRFAKRMELGNHSGTSFEIEVDRTIGMLGAADIASHLGGPLGSGVRAVGYESSNSVTNVGREPWMPKTGLVSVWILGMYKPSPDTTIVIPFAPGPESKLGPVVNDRYFGKVPVDRLVARETALFVRGDGQYRSKIGVSPARARGVAGSYDAAGRVLTLVQYTRSPDARAYVNSMWEIQKNPYDGDAINSYNDGPPAPGQPPLGPFYELETSSPALSLSPGRRYTHVHRTFHLVGPEQELDRIARRVLAVGLSDIAGAFTR
jgi:hypothetical protein